MSGLWRLGTSAGIRLARGGPGEGPTQLLAPDVTIDELLGDGAATLADLDRLPVSGPVPEEHSVLAPVASQEIWAAGVTYMRSRDARMEESTNPDHYDRVYDATRPEVFYKAAGWRARGPGQTLGIRRDSVWDVPEPELGVVADAGGSIVGYVLGNDMSSRSIEGENPLYLPQAKAYDHSCGLGPCLVPVDFAPPREDMVIQLLVDRGGTQIFSEEVSVRDLRRTPEELVDWLFSAVAFPVGAILLTGTAMVPPGDFTLEEEDRVSISMPGLGRLANPVERVGRVIPEVSDR